MRKEDLASNFQLLPFHPSFSSDKTFISMKTELLIHFYLFSQLKACFHKTSKNFSFIELHETHSFTMIQKTHFHLNLMKYLLESIETCFFMILHENIIIWSHVHFFNFWSKFHHPHMILVIQHVCQVCEFKHLLNSDSHEKQKSSRKHLKIHNQASWKFSIL